MKNYATETDIIEIADPLFYPGDRVEWKCGGPATNGLTVESFSWNALKKSWTYTLLYFLTDCDGYDNRRNGSLAIEEAFEDGLKLVFRQPRK